MKKTNVIIGLIVVAFLAIAIVSVVYPEEESYMIPDNECPIIIDVMPDMLPAAVETTITGVVESEVVLEGTRSENTIYYIIFEDIKYELARDWGNSFDIETKTIIVDLVGKEVTLNGMSYGAGEYGPFFTESCN
ncbi:MAG: hypothetical protein KJ718_04615 [Nanoarchaeota archaeon]|nr:hypothetical protein [Nanoarchaeota archaeon]MBU1051809.1 hypothetical protein [Nanoarchaeota archaeon]MBU1988775.1 hypothetical protein [Nanoarchaeota archaeon]